MERSRQQTSLRRQQGTEIQVRFRCSHTTTLLLTTFSPEDSVVSQRCTCAVHIRAHTIKRINCVCVMCVRESVCFLLLLLARLFHQVFVVLVVCPEQLVPPGEGGGVVAHEVHVVEVMEASAGVEGDEVERIERNVVTTVNVDGLQETEGNPGPQQHHVVTEDHDADEEAGSQDQSLGRVCVLGLHAERGSELMVDLVDVFVDTPVVQRPMQEVVPGVLNHSTAKTLGQQVGPAGHGVPVVGDVEELSEVVGATDERQLDAEVVEQQHLETLPLFLPSLRLVLLDLILLHEGQELEQEARHTEQEVDELVNDERSPGGDLELGVVVQHVIPGLLQRGLEGVGRQHCVYVLHCQVRRAQDVGCAVDFHVDEG